MRIIFKVFCVFAFLLISVAYFLWIYNNIGLHFTVKCLFVWGFCLASYTVSAWLIKMLFEDFT